MREARTAGKALKEAAGKGLRGAGKRLGRAQTGEPDPSLRTVAGAGRCVRTAPPYSAVKGAGKGPGTAVAAPPD